MEAKRWVVLVVAMGLITSGFLHSPALAHHRQRRFDSNDTDGRLNALSWELRIYRKRVSCRVRFFQDVRPRTFDGTNGFFCDFDYRGTDGTRDAYVHVHLVDGRIRGELYRVATPMPTFVRFVPAAVNAHKDIAVARVGRRHLTGRPRGMRWRGRTTFSNRSECLTPCEDFGPSRNGWYRYRHR